MISYLGDSRPLGAPGSSGNSTRMLTSVAPSTTTTTLVGPVRPSTPPPGMLNAANMPVAQAVPDLPGYVRTPFTNPPRLVDVRGMSAGSKVVCPYTQRPFLVPGGVSTKSSMASTPAPSRPKITEAPERPSSPPVSANSNVAAMNNSTPSTPTPEATPPPGAAPDLPFGSAIAGRPGFVNSPYAAKHQLVDVTGLPVGMEVKCPYTGKLFRVPPQ
ncbi:MAG: hypothetical protein ACO1TE_05130 [Prosthecobacter sp.]